MITLRNLAVVFTVQIVYCVIFASANLQNFNFFTQRRSLCCQSQCGSCATPGPNCPGSSPPPSIRGHGGSDNSACCPNQNPEEDNNQCDCNSECENECGGETDGDGGQGCSSAVARSTSTRTSTPTSSLASKTGPAPRMTRRNVSKRRTVTMPMTIPGRNNPPFTLKPTVN